MKIRLVFTDGDWMTRHPELGSKVAVWPRAYFHLSNSAQSLRGCRKGEEVSIWIVRVALRRPYTFVVLALLILILSPVVILRTPTDIFPNVDIPVIAVAFSYTGLNPEEMEGRITTVFERLVTTVTNDVEHIESTTINGQAIVRIFFQPGANVDRATAQITAGSQTVLRFLPPGSQPPVMINYSASTVPILQLALSGQGSRNSN